MFCAMAGRLDSCPAGNSSVTCGSGGEDAEERTVGAPRSSLAVSSREREREEEHRWAWEMVSLCTLAGSTG